MSARTPNPLPAPRTSAFAAAARMLLRTVRRRGDLRPGSLLITLFGDAIAPRGGVVALASLIRAGALFGITERHVRTAVGRLANDGWLVAQRRGRVSFYSLSELGRRRFAEATRRIYGDPRTPWDGQWTLVALLTGLGDRRERVREEMALLGFGQLQPGLLASPLRSAEDTAAALADLEVSEHVLITRAQALGVEDDRRIALTAWNLNDLERRYRDFALLFEPIARAIGRSAEVEPDSAFMVRTLLVHEYRRVHLRDPLLPASLLPPDWSGQSAAALCRELYGAVFHRAERYLTDSMHSDTGRLPGPKAETLRRFGGLPAV